jgi:hypothetical protein
MRYRKDTQNDVGENIDSRACVQVVDVIDAVALSGKTPCSRYRLALEDGHKDAKNP